MFEEELGRALGIAIREQLELLRAELRAEIVELKAANAELRGQIAVLQKSGVNFRDVYEDGTQYAPGDCVVSGGSLWRANEQTRSKPGSDICWRLVCRKGRDGKDAMNGRAHT